MSEKKTLITAAGVVTTLNFDNGLPQFLQVGTVDTDLPIRKLEVSVSGKSYSNIPSLALCQAYAKYMNEFLGGADVKVCQTLIIADGFIPGKNAQIRLTNDGATTPKIYAYSTRKGSTPVGTSVVVVQNLASQLFSGFEALIFAAANLDYADLVFSDGHKDKFSGPELAGLFARDHQTDADGLLAAQTVIDNQDGSIVQVELYANGGTLTVLQVA